MGKVISVGRSGTDVLLSDPQVSRLHLTLEPLEDGWVRVIDQRSTNGTFRWLEQGGSGGWQPFTEGVLHQSERIALGQHQALVSDLLAGVASPSQPSPVAAADGSAPFSRYIRSSSGRYEER